MIIGTIKGYKVCSINNLKNVDLFEEIELKSPNIKENIKRVIEGKGIIYALKKNKKLKSIYLFESIKEEKNRLLRFIEKVSVDEISEEIEQELEKNIYEEFTELVTFEDYDKIEWNDKEIIPKMVKIGKFNITLGGLCLFLGITVGIIIDDLIWGTTIGIIAGSAVGSIVRNKK